MPDRTHRPRRSRRSRRSLSALLTLALLGTAFAAVGSLTGPAYAAASRVSVLQVNVNGGNYAGRPRALDDVVRQIDKRPDVVLLQEVCQRQLKRLERRYPGQLASQGIGATAKCGSAAKPLQSYYVVLSKWGLVDPVFHPYSTGLSKGVFCASVLKSDGAFKACSTKFDSGGVENNNAPATRLQQSKELKAIIAGTYPGVPLVLSGDLNAQPGARELDAVYRTGRGGKIDDPKGQRGLFWEGDETDAQHFGDRTNGVTCKRFAPNPTHCRTGARTHNLANLPAGGRKIDYAFFKHDTFDGNSVRLEVVRRTNREASKGKHAMLVARATPTY